MHKLTLEPRVAGALAAVALAIFAILLTVVWRWLATPDPTPPFLCRERKRLTLIDRSAISHDTRRLVFGLEQEDQPLGLPVGQHVLVYGPNRRGREEGKWNGQPDPEEGEEISRKYTPVSSVHVKGRLELVVKVYASNKLQQFPDGGKMSQYLEGLEIGDQVDVNGPFGLIKYKGYGAFDVGSRKVVKKKVGLLAGGTGITPVFQLIKSVLENHADHTKLYLIYANKTEDDILLRDELEEFENEYPDRLRLWYTLDKPPPEWKYSSGFIDADMIKEHLPPPSEDTMVFCCGPLPMVQFACKDNLAKLGYSKDDVACF